jgi:hypothetical protein
VTDVSTGTKPLRRKSRILGYHVQKGGVKGNADTRRKASLPTEEVGGQNRLSVARRERAKDSKGER